MAILSASIGEDFARPGPPSRSIFIRDIAMVDAGSPKPRLHRDVLIRGGRIVSIAVATTHPTIGTATMVDGRGKYLIPGLWDMHVHGTRIPAFSALYIYNGVTGVRDMFDMTNGTFGIRKLINSGRMIGPRIVAAGKPIDGPSPVWPGSYTASNASEGRRAVATALANGSDFIKVYSLLPRDAFFAIADESKKRHVPFAGHVPESVTALEASDAGIHSMEHLYGILRECSPLFKTPMNLFGNHAKWAHYQPIWLKTYDPRLAAKLFAHLRKNNTYQVPTLSVWYFLNLPKDPRLDQQYRFLYMPSGFKSRFESERRERYAKWTPADFRLEADSFAEDLKLVGAMNRAGVPIMAGTDVNNPYCFPGFGLHDELRWLVKAGLTPFQALRSATLTPAEYLGLQKSLGTVSVGKLADCVILNANPLTNIGNTEKIFAVIARGRLLDRGALDALAPKRATP